MKHIISKNFKKEEKEKEMIEELAELEHKQWSHWTKYMLNDLIEENIKRWEKQTKINYKDLSEKEKDSDREWAQKVLKIVNKYID